MRSTARTGRPAARIVDARIVGSSFIGFGRIGGAFLFSANPIDEPLDLWRTDGTAAGTRRMNQTMYSFPRTAAIGPRTLLISTDYSMLRTDGTTASTVFGVPKSWASDAVAVDDGFLAVGTLPETGLEPFHLDADGANPRLVADLYPGTPGRSRPRAFGRVGDRVLFTTGEYGVPTEWHVTDGQTVSTLSGMAGRPAELDPATVDGVTYLVNRDGEDALLYRTDDTTAGTILLRRFRYGGESPPELFTGFNGTTWFAAGDLDHGRELWRTDGTPTGTRLEYDISPGRPSSDPLDFVATDDFLFFTAFDPANGAEPWRNPARRAAGRPGEPGGPARGPAGDGRADSAHAGAAGGSAAPGSAHHAGEAHPVDPGRASAHRAWPRAVARLGNREGGRLQRPRADRSRPPRPHPQDVQRAAHAVLLPRDRRHDLALERPLAAGPHGRRRRCLPPRRGPLGRRGQALHGGREAGGDACRPRPRWRQRRADARDRCLRWSLSPYPRTGVDLRAARSTCE